MTTSTSDDKADFDDEHLRDREPVGLSKDRAPSSGLESESQSHDAHDDHPSDEAAPFLPRSRLDRFRLRAPQRPWTHAQGEHQTGKEMLVDFDGKDDPYHPKNWPQRKKMATVVMYGLCAAGAAFNSAILSTAVEELAVDFHVSTIVTSLVTTMILLGFASGPLLWGPLSELYGRKWVVMLPYAISVCFTFGTGASDNLQSLFITRYFAGVFSGSVITNTGGALGDIFEPKDRGIALIIYSLSVVGGPLLSPIVGSAIVTSYLGWRWILYIVGILQATFACLALLFVDESYAPTLLKRKASRLRFVTGNWALHSADEEADINFSALARKYLVRPFQLLGNPVCFLVCFYASFVYALIYGSLSAIPVVFEQHRGWSPVVGSLPFLALLLGCIAGLFTNLVNQRFYLNAMAKNGGKPVPEARLYPMMVGGFTLVFGLFIFAWTGATDIFWFVPFIGIFLIGTGFFPIFQASLNYLVDTFLSQAASCVAAATFCRSTLASTFPLFMEPMLDALGVGWGLSLLGFVGVAMLPVPFFFYVWGNRRRARRQKQEQEGLQQQPEQKV